MQVRTYGWVQNPSDFNKLKLVVQILDSGSAHYRRLRDSTVQDVIHFDDVKRNLQSKLDLGEEIFTYKELVGTQRNALGEVASRRADAVADSLIQITVMPQSYKTTGKNFTDNWTSQGYLSWALSLGFLEHSPETDTVKITTLGREFSQSAVDPVNDKYLLQAICSYPPATRVMNILENAKNDKGEYIPLSKFQIGSQLGFKGEPGYTSYSHELAEQALIESTSSKEQNSFRQDFEGTSDKYARMIASWLTKLRLVKSVQTKIPNSLGKKISTYQRYLLTAKGVQLIKRINGNSSHRRVQKHIPWAMLGTKVENLNYVRTRRAIILNYLLRSTSMTKLREELQSKGFKDSTTIIQADILGLNGIGIRISHSDDWQQLILKDSFKPIEIPLLNVTQEAIISERVAQKERLMESTDLPMRFYELIDIAYDGRRNRDFEMLTMDLLREGYGFETQLLGGGRKPDVIAYNDDFGIIVDTKAYGKGYHRSQPEEDKMVRYVEDNRERDASVNNTQWWLGFPETLSYQSVYFLWVSSFFTGQFGSQLTNAAIRSRTNGAALGVENLLVGADKFLKGKLNHSQIQLKIRQDSEIIWD